MTRQLKLAAVLVALVPALVAGQELIHRPVTVSFFPPVSSNGMQGADVSTNFSLNIVCGYVGRVTGGELGFWFNAVRTDMTGFQACVGANVVGEDMVGVQQAAGANIVGRDVAVAQFAAGANVAGRDVLGAQFAAGANIAGHDVLGVQAAGGANTAGHDMLGAQLAGGVCVAGQDAGGLQAAGGAVIAGRNVVGAQLAGGACFARRNVTGFQAAGGVNICGEAATAQFGVVNIAGEEAGFQAGVVNITERVKGVQLGLVNIAEESDLSIGLISIIAKGRFNICTWASEAPLACFGLKTGSKYVYNVFAVGYHPLDPTRAALGLGIGGHVPLDRFYLDVDAVGWGFYRGPDWLENLSYASLFQLRPTLGWRVTDWLAVAAGPTLSCWVADDETGADIPLYDAPIYERIGSPNIRVWPGFTVGLELL